MKESKVSTTMGIQGHSMEGCRLICEWIWAGAIGDVYEVEAYCPLSTYSSEMAIGYAPDSPNRPTETPPVPATLDWDLWIGPAAMRPYHPCYHPRKWLAWWDFGTGMLGGRGIHGLDPVMRALKLDAPETVAATSLAPHPETFPPASIVTYQFPARGDMPPVTLKWYEGLLPPRPRELEDNRQLHKPDGTIFRGTKGVMICGMYGTSPRIIPETKMQEFLPNLPPKTLPRTANHYQQWLAACKNGTTAAADFEYSSKLTEICLLGMVAMRTGSLIRWDAENMRLTNLDSANPYVRPEYRKGWSLT